MKKSIDYAVIAIGGILLALGLYLAIAKSESKGIMLALPYVCVGLGCGVFGHGMGNIISKKTMKIDPKLAKQQEIDRNDERNVAINNRAKAKAYDCMTFVFGALVLSFALMNSDLIATLLMVFAYLFVHGYAIFYRCKYDKEM